MPEQDAIFGGEHSGHYYSRDFWRADTGMLAALQVLSALGSSARPAVGADQPLRAVRRQRQDQHQSR